MLWIDEFRVVAAFLVAAIHTWPLQSVWEPADFVLVHIIGRIAVPFFFCVTGYFGVSRFWEKTSDGAYGRLMKKNAQLYGLAMLLYLPVNVYAGQLRNVVGAGRAGSAGLAGALEGVGKLLKAVAFDGTFYHLWYLPAILLGVTLLKLLSRWVSAETVGIISVLLYLCGLLGDSYYGLAAKVPALEMAYGKLFAISSYTRNGLFFAPLFLMLGVFLKRTSSESKKTLKNLSLKKNEKKNLKTPDHGFWLTGFLFSVLLLTGEGLLLRKLGWPRHDSMYITLPLVLWCLMRLLLAGKRERTHREKRLGRECRTFAAAFYVVHPLMIVAVRGGVKVIEAVLNTVTGAGNISFLLVNCSPVFYVEVCLLAGLVAVLTAHLTELHRQIRFQKGRAWVEVEQAAFRHNVRELQTLLPGDCALMPAIKADGYGMGTKAAAKLLRKEGVKAFCVASVREGGKLRRSGVQGEILVLGYTSPEQFGLLKRYRLTQTVVDAAYGREMEASGYRLKGQVKVDTGMHRLGEAAADIDQIAALYQLPHVKITGIFTHLCVSDEQTPDSQAFTRLQIARFHQVLDALEQKGIQPGRRHMFSSYGIWNREGEPLDAVRPGIALLGVRSNREDVLVRACDMRPVLSIHARVALVRRLDAGEYAGYGRCFHAVKPSRIAVVTIGYADGIPRSLSCGKGFVLIKGRRAPIAGRICMDQLLVDVTDLPKVKRGDEVVLLGRQGKEEISAEEMAGCAGAITNELLSRLGSRLERVYK